LSHAGEVVLRFTDTYQQYFTHQLRELGVIIVLTWHPVDYIEVELGLTGVIYHLDIGNGEDGAGVCPFEDLDRQQSR
jgi:hypothetical protein